MKSNNLSIHVLAIIMISGSLVACSYEKKKEAAKPPPKKMMETEAVAEKKKEKPHWGYEGLFGPSLWGNLDPSYALCKDGKAQSPIDLVFKRPTGTKSVEVNYKDGPLAIADTGHAVLVTGTKGSLISLGGDVYNLVQMTMHSPSEHTLSGRRFAAEIHFVHKNQAGQILVVGVLVNEGAPLGIMDEIIKSVPAVKKQVKKAEVDFNPSVLMPAVKTHYSYNGSLTTPPCTEGLSWVVMNTPISMSKEQIASLRGYYNNNVRPVQALNGRTVTNF